MSGPNHLPVHTYTSQSVTLKTTGTANTSRVDPPTASSVSDGEAAGANGAKVERVYGVATVATAAGKAQVWHKRAADSDKYHMIGEVTTSAITPSATVSGATFDFTPTGDAVELMEGDKIAVTMTQAEVWEVHIVQKGY